MKKILALFSALVLCSAIAVTVNWQPLPNTVVNFTIDGLFGKDVKGTIGSFRSEIEFYPEEVSRSSIRTSIDAATINTRNKKRDAHLRTADFLEVEKYPAIRFESTSFRQVGEYYVVEGNLTLKDVTKPITIPFEFTTQGDSAVFSGDFNIKRLDYHVGKKSKLMGNEVRVHLNIPVKKP